MFDTLTAMGLNPRKEGTMIYFGTNESIDLTTGRTRLSANRDVSSLKQAYGNQVVTATAKRYGWQVKSVGANKYQIIKR